jgi:hypothetical protein
VEALVAVSRWPGESNGRRLLIEEVDAAEFGLEPADQLRLQESGVGDVGAARM